MMKLPFSIVLAWCCVTLMCLTTVAQPGSQTGGYGSVGPGGGAGGATNGQTLVQVQNTIANNAIMQTNGTGQGTKLTNASVGFSRLVGMTLELSGGTNVLNLSNTLASQSSPTNLTLSSGLYDGGANAIQMKVGNSLKGNGADNTTVIVYNTSADGTTNGGSFWLSDNCSISDLYINQTNVEGWCVTPIGGQRKNQTAPVPSAGNLASTSTNVFIRNVKINGAKTGTIIVNCTNVFDWRIVNCDLSATANQAVAFGLAKTTGDGASPIDCVNTNDYGEIIDTSLELKSTASVFQCGALVNFSGTAKLILNKVNLNGTASCAAVRVSGTNSVVHVAIVGPQTHPNASSYNSILVDGATNTIYLEGGIYSILDQGAGNIYITNQQVLTLNGANIVAGTLPITAADGTWAVASNYLHTIGPLSGAMVPIWNGTFDSFGSPNYTNASTSIFGGGGSDTPWSVTHDAQSQSLINLNFGTWTNTGIAVFSFARVSGGGAKLVIGAITNNVTANSTLEVTNVNAVTVTATPQSGAGSNYFGGTTTVTNIWTSTNAPPTSVTIGVTTPDKWIQIRDLSGNLYWQPAWTNH